MANDILKLKDFELKEIVDRTNLEGVYVEYMINKEFEKLQSVNMTGFVKILEREYGLDLNDWCEEFEAYRAEHTLSSNTKGISPKIPSYTPASSPMPVWIFVLVVAVIAATIWIGSNLNTLKEMFGEIRQSAISYSNNEIAEEAQQSLNQVESSEPVATQIDIDELNATEPDATEADTAEPEPVATEIKPASVKIIPQKPLWIGIKAIDGKYKRNMTINAPFEVDLAMDAVIMTGHGELVISRDGEDEELRTQAGLKMAVIDGELKVVDNAEFVRLNGGKMPW